MGGPSLLFSLGQSIRSAKGTNYIFTNNHASVESRLGKNNNGVVSYIFLKDLRQITQLSVNHQEKNVTDFNCTEVTAQYLWHQKLLTSCMSTNGVGCDRSFVPPAAYSAN